VSKSNNFETAFLQSLFESAALATIGTSPAVALGANFYIGVHTSDPGEAGTAVTNEATFTGYARVAMPRDTATWTVTGNEVLNDIDVSFPLCTGGTNTVSHWSIVNTSAGAGTVL
jgi:hypothetical protein